YLDPRVDSYYWVQGLSADKGRPALRFNTFYCTMMDGNSMEVHETAFVTSSFRATDVNLSRCHVVYFWIIQRWKNESKSSC
ncbi:hypothetical protein QSE00_09500, partial [Arenibacter sp. M-2]|uniref:hypothetical protein n=1 Tax=Arenibacter sp. M-2 TaxID=3053612 RepID=UPI002570C058